VAKASQLPNNAVNVVGAVGLEPTTNGLRVRATYVLSVCYCLRRLAFKASVYNRCATISRNSAVRRPMRHAVIVCPYHVALWLGALAAAAHGHAAHMHGDLAALCDELARLYSAKARA